MLISILQLIDFVISYVSVGANAFPSSSCDGKRRISRCIGVKRLQC